MSLGQQCHSISTLLLYIFVLFLERMGSHAHSVIYASQQLFPHQLGLHVGSLASWTLFPLFVSSAAEGSLLGWCPEKAVPGPDHTSSCGIQTTQARRPDQDWPLLARQSDIAGVAAGGYYILDTGLFPVHICLCRTSWCSCSPSSPPYPALRIAA